MFILVLVRICSSAWLAACSGTQQQQVASQTLAMGDCVRVEVKRYAQLRQGAWQWLQHAGVAKHMCETAVDHCLNVVLNSVRIRLAKAVYERNYKWKIFASSSVLA
jgi:hypothetical protein